MCVCVYVCMCTYVCGGGRWPQGGDVRGEIECFASCKGHVTDWHADYQENFTFQLKGKKKWTLKARQLAPPSVTTITTGHPSTHPPPPPPLPCS